MAVLLVLSMAAPLSAIDTGELDHYAEQRLKEHLVRGAARVIVRDGRILHSRAFGEARRGVAMTVDTPVVIGSLSKAFTATAVLQLVDQKKIELDKPVQHYLGDSACWIVCFMIAQRCRAEGNHDRGMRQSNCGYGSSMATMAMAQIPSSRPVKPR